MPLPAPARLLLLSPEIAAAVDPGLLRALVEARFAPQLAKLVGTGRNGKARLATARALWGRRVPVLVADALHELARFATTAGRDALVEAARDTGTEHAGWEEASPVDLAARLLADHVRTSHLFVRAHLRLARLPVKRATYARRAGPPARVPQGRTRALVEALRRVAGGASDGRDARAWTDAWVHEDEETGDLHAVVLHGLASDGAPELRETGPDLPAPRRWLRADAFHYRVADGRLATTLARPQRLGAYAAAWGRALHDDEEHFLLAPSLTLKPLQVLGAAGLASARLPPEIERVRVIACQLDTGKKHRVEARGLDALTPLEPHLRAGGHLTRATLRFDIAGELRQIDVALQLPHRIDVGWAGVAGHGARGPRIAREALASLGLLSPGAIEDDITTLLPLVHPEWRWRELAGADGLAAMIEAGILDEVSPDESRRPAQKTMRHLGRSAIAFRLYRPVGPAPVRIDPDAPKVEKDLARALANAMEAMRKYTDYYAVPEDWSLPAFTVPQQDLVALRLGMGALLRKARREMGLERGPKVKLPRGVHRVGELRVEGGVVSFFYVVRATTSDRDRIAIGKAIVRATGFGRAVVLVPKGRALGLDSVEIELTVPEQLGAASWRARVPEAVRALGIEDRVAPELLAPGDARLVVDTRRERVLLDGVPLVTLGESGYRLLRVLAEHGGGGTVVSTAVTDKAISSARESEGATRKAVWKMRGWLESSFAHAGKELPEDVREAGLVRAVGRKGWMLTVKAAVT